MSRRDKAVLAAALAIGIPVAVGVALDQPKHPSVSAPPAASAPATSAAGKPAGQSPKAKVPVSWPTLRYPGDHQCAITYRDRGDGSMSWTATVTVSGDLRTHVSDRSGDLYSHDVPVQQGPTSLAAPFPLSQLSDIGGVLYTSAGSSYTCSIAPAVRS